MIGIYLIQNTINGKSYVGKSIDISRRWSKHRSDTFNELSEVYNYPLYRAMRKYGIENFKFSVLEECSETELNEKEKYWISKFDTFNNGYNQTLGGELDHSKPIKITESQLDEIISLLKFSTISISNIAKQFSVGVDTISEINNGRTRIRVGETYPIRKRKLKFCKICGAKTKTTAGRCVKCARRATRKIDRPAKDTLLELLKNNSFVSVGKMFGVTDNAIRRWLGLK